MKNNTSTIREFSGPYWFLSNFFTATTEYDGLIFGSSEAAFQAQKCARSEDRVAFTTMTPSESKKAGRMVPLRPDWENVKCEIMHEIVLAKFTQHIELANRLIATGDATLIEGNTWGDTFWGVDLHTGCGNNQLGRILMKVRMELAVMRVKTCVVHPMPDGCLDVSTPLVTAAGDNVDICVLPTENSVVITDNGETFGDLVGCGLVPENGYQVVTMLNAVDAVLSDSGVTRKGKWLIAEVPVDEKTNLDAVLLRFAAVMLQVRAAVTACDWLQKKEVNNE